LTRKNKNFVASNNNYNFDPNPNPNSTTNNNNLQPNVGICKQFMQMEKKISRFFFRQLKIFSNRFYESEYAFLKPLLMDEYFMNRILTVIDDIIKDVPNVNRFVVLGDFLFSMTFCELNDPANSIFKTTRNDYIDRIKFRAAININLGYEPMEYIKIHKKLLIGLRLAAILQKIEVRTKKDS
jgi:hypothetical protein